MEVEHRDIVCQNVAISNIEVRMRNVKEGINYNHQGMEYLTEDVLQLQISSTKAKMDKVERILKMTCIKGI